MRWARAGLSVFGLLWAAPALAVGCEPVVARLVSLQGVIELRRMDAQAWSPAATDAVLCPGDALRVGERSRAALRLANESVLRLDQNSTITLAPPEQETAFIELLRGALNVLTRTPKPFTIRTPFLNAGVEGTEFLVRVEADAARVVVFEGRVAVSNAAGALQLGSRQQALAERDAAPRRGQTVTPPDAVQWALHYPGIVSASAAEPGSLREARALASRGLTSEAFARLEAVSPAERDARHHVYRAELLLSVGSVDEARAEIARTLAIDPVSSDALALQALIKVVRNELAEGQRLADEAVRREPDSATAHLALSYAQLAGFDIAAALNSSETAARLEPGNAVAWARTAELRMAGGDLDAALLAAQRASQLMPDLARTQTVLGFAHLARFDTPAARQAFGRAIALDPADHLPRLGLGLALIRDGELTAGREAMEIAAGLDPLSALTRSYLGKVYHEERRGALAASQFELAKALDPNDPTPWFYDAIRQQSEHAPVPALRDLERAIELNDHRAIYRSRLLLDEDRASRVVSIAQIYRDLGFNELAVIEASRSLGMDPTNASAHRFLSDAYAELPRQEVARASALLQSQLLQPLSLVQAQPSAPFIHVSPSAQALFSRPGFNEYSRLYERRDDARVSLAAVVGSDGARGDELVASLLRERFALSLGQFHYQFDGFRPNGGVRHDIYNALLQVAATPELTLQAELRSRKTRHGDISFEFDPQDYLPVSHVEIRQQVARLGLAWQPSPHARVIASFMDNRREERQRHEDSGLEIGLYGTAPGRQSEVQLQLLSEAANLVLGGGSSRVDFDTQARIVDTTGVIFGGYCSAAEPCNSVDRSLIRQSNGYVYANLTPLPTFTATLGLSHEAYEDAGLTLRQWNPKLGVRWQAAPWLGVAAAAFKSVKRALIVDQTIEPTQIAGVNQFHDDINGTRTRTLATALDLRLAPNLKGLLELQRRRLRLGPSAVGADLQAGPYEEWRERVAAAGLFWSIEDRTTVTLQARRERFDRDPLIMDDRPTAVTTLSVPLTLRHFFANGFSTRLGATHVRQQIGRQAISAKPAGVSRFVLVDAAITYRIPSFDASIHLAINNLMDEKFSYQDDNFRSSQAHLPRYLPGRNVALSASLSF